MFYRFSRFVVLFGICVILMSKVHAQEADSLKEYHFNGHVSVTNNGFSLIPTFSLGEPALIADVSLGGKRFSFDPQFRFDLAGLKPWSFIFIWRYKFVNNSKWLVRLGTHMPAIVFIKESYQSNGSTMERLIPRRFLTPELTLTYKLSDRVSLGAYYLFGIGLEKENQTRYTHFISGRFYFTDIPIARNLFIKWVPQLYYLTLDGTDGVYVASDFEIYHGTFPLSLSTMMNLEVNSDIVTDAFQWNINLIYSFKNTFTRRRRNN